MTALNSKPQMPAKMVEALLIGGANDGKRLMVSQHETIINHTFKRGVMTQPIHELDSPAMIHYDIERYYRVPFELSDGVQRGEFLLFLHESIKMDMFDVVQRLYMGYGRKKA